MYLFKWTNHFHNIIVIIVPRFIPGIINIIINKNLQCLCHVWHLIENTLSFNQLSLVWNNNQSILLLMEIKYF